MKTYLNAIVETLLIMLIAGVAAVGMMWLFMSEIHASRTVLIDSEIIAVIATAIASVFFFKMVLRTEKRLSAEEKGSGRRHPTES